MIKLVLPIAIFLSSYGAFANIDINPYYAPGFINDRSYDEMSPMEHFQTFLDSKASSITFDLATQIKQNIIVDSNSSIKEEYIKFALYGRSPCEITQIPVSNKSGAIYSLNCQDLNFRIQLRQISGLRRFLNNNFFEVIEN